MSDLQPLTAELCARAIVAAARSYGDDPARVLLARRGPMRRALMPAGVALARATGLPLARVAHVVEFEASKRARVERLGGLAYQAALTQALLAIGGVKLVLASDPVPAEPSPVIEGEFAVVEEAPAPAVAKLIAAPAQGARPAPPSRGASVKATAPATPLAPAPIAVVELAPERIEAEKRNLDRLRDALRARKGARRCPEVVQVAGRPPEACGVLLTGDVEFCRLHTPRRLVGRGKNAEKLVRSADRLAP